jgi:hypothetical protein
VALGALTALWLLFLFVVPEEIQSSKDTAPESFRASGQITSAPGGVASKIGIQIDRYSSEADHEAIVAAMKAGGTAAFVEALRKAPQIGSVTIGDRSVAIHWARQQPQGQDHRRIAVMTDQPIFFYGGGAVDAKPTAGFDVALIEFTVDVIGFGSGTMAGAARVKAGGTTGIDVEDYAGKRVTLVTVARNVRP